MDLRTLLLLLLRKKWREKKEVKVEVKREEATESQKSNRKIKKKQKEKDKKTTDDDQIYKQNIITGDTALHLAAEGGHVKCVHLLFLLEAKLENKNRVGSTVLHRAVSMNRLEVVNFLLDHGANLSATNKIGNTPLHCASYCGYLDIAAALLKYGAFKDIHKKNKVEMTPLDYAKKTSMQQLLLNFKPADDSLGRFDRKLSLDSDIKSNF